MRVGASTMAGVTARLRLKFQDLEDARVHLAALKDLFLQGNRRDARLLRRISALCSAAHALLQDPYCSAKIASMAQCAAVWVSQRRNERPELYLEQLLDLLDLLQSRIYAIEAIRRASRTSLMH
jgi:hypothetical protein